MFKPLAVADVVWTIEADVDENAGPLESFDDPEVAASVIRAADSNIWAWCVVTVTAEWNGWKGKSYLGRCSYDSQKEFEADAYCSDMKNEALSNLNALIEKQYKVLSKLFA